MQYPSAPVVETRYGALAGFTDNTFRRGTAFPTPHRPLATGAGAHRDRPNAGMGFARQRRFPPQAGKAANIARSWAAGIPDSFQRIVFILMCGRPLTALSRCR